MESDKGEAEISCIAKNGGGGSSNYDELFMHRRSLFSDTLKDLKNLRKQLYSAAEYFEVSYQKDDYNELVVETLKEYVTKAVVGTVDHLGSVAYKVNGYLDEQLDQVSLTALRISCIEKRLQTCREYSDLRVLSQQSLMIKTPKHYKQYIIPGGNVDTAAAKPKLIHKNQTSLPQVRPKNAIQMSTMRTPSPSSFIRKGNSRPPYPKFTSTPGNFTFTRVIQEKRTISPFRFPLKRSESVTSRSTSPHLPNNRNRYSSEPRRTVSLNVHPDPRESEQQSKKSKSLLRALLSIHKSKKDVQGKPYRYRDDN
jgi:hypothetical protein